MEMYFLDLVDIVVLWYIVFPEPATFHVFWASALTKNVFSIVFTMTISKWL